MPTLNHKNTALGIPLIGPDPNRDPNLIRFVGRSDFLEILWNWMADRTAPIRIITALGGTGKTSLAYEFCTQVVDNKPSWLTNLVWLSAKKRYFSAINDKYVEITKVDFFDSLSFLKSALMELGAVQNDIDECDEEEDELIELFVDNVKLFPSIIVIDDIDSLEIEEQRNLFSILNVIAGRVASSGVKFIFTSRLDFGAVGQRIKLEGFPEKEFKEFARMVSDERGVKLGDDQIVTIFKASLGSPVFCSSILRLVSLGTSVYEATKAWKDRAGEDVRKFAFERELELLTESQARVLFALTVLGQASQLELRKILEVDEARLIDDLTKLRDFHLYSVNDNPSSGSLLSVSNPVSLMQELIRKRITDPTRIERECARARKNSPKGDDQVASAIGAVLALRSDGAHDEALVVARTASKKNPKSGDLHCMLGSCYLSVSPSKPSEAEKSFKRAFDNGCKRPELYRLWIKAKWEIQDYIGILDLEKTAPDQISGTTAFYVIESLEILARQSMGNGDDRRAIERHRDAMRKASYYLRARRTHEVTPQIRETCKGNARSYIILVDRFSTSDADRLDVFRAVFDAFKCHVTDANYLRLGAKAFFDWSNDALRRRGDQPAVHKILNDRLFDLGEIVKLLKKEDRDENLIGYLQQIQFNISDNFSAAKSIHKM